MSIAHRGLFTLCRARAARVPFVVGVTVLAPACVGLSTVISPDPHAHDLAGVWIDSAKATPSDTVAWRLDRNGADWTLRITVARDDSNRVTTEQRETRYGYWYVEGSLADTSGRALCFKTRPRDGGTCYPFRLDTLAAGTTDSRPRRQLVISGYRGQQHTRTRVLVERVP